MPLQNRVTPFGELTITSARGLMMGNRGGRIHGVGRKLGARRWASKQWICCVLSFKGRQRDVWGRSYTELFFLDEVTSFAGGHRPCFECRRQDAMVFAELFESGQPHSVHSREIGNPVPPTTVSAALGPRLRGDERRMKRVSASMMDAVLHAERLDGKAKRLNRRAIDDLPDGAMIVRDGKAFAVRGTKLLRWTPSGYDDTQPRPASLNVDVLTPPSILTVLENGYAPLWHKSAH